MICCNKVAVLASFGLSDVIVVKVYLQKLLVCLGFLYWIIADSLFIKGILLLL